MPRYDYRYTSCGDEFELIQSFSEAGTGSCPVCPGAGQRVFHAVPVIYKGSGFYTTDYARPKPPEENGSKPEKESKESKSTSTDGASSSTSSTSSSESSSTSSGGKGESTSKATSESET